MATEQKDNAEEQVETGKNDYNKIPAGQGKWNLLHLKLRSHHMFPENLDLIFHFMSNFIFEFHLSKLFYE